MKCLRGYVSSRIFLGMRVPQYVQNIVLRDYCKNFNFTYLLSGTEYAMKESYLILRELVDEIPKIDGIVFYSLFQIPEDQDQRMSIYSKVLNRSGELHFALEGLSIVCAEDIDRIENIWLVSQTMDSCLAQV